MCEYCMSYPHKSGCPAADDEPLPQCPHCGSTDYEKLYKWGRDMEVIGCSDCVYETLEV